MDPASFLALLTAVVAGGFGTELLRTITGRKRASQDAEAAEFILFYPTWKEELTRLHAEIGLLRRDIIALSAEVHRLGGDPLAVRYGQYPEPKEDQT